MRKALKNVGYWNRHLTGYDADDALEFVGCLMQALGSAWGVNFPSGSGDDFVVVVDRAWDVVGTPGKDWETLEMVMDAIAERASKELT